MEVVKRGSTRRILVPAVKHNLVADEHNDKTISFMSEQVIISCRVSLVLQGERIEGSPPVPKSYSLNPCSNDEERIPHLD